MTTPSLDPSIMQGERYATLIDSIHNAVRHMDHLGMGRLTLAINLTPHKSTIHANSFVVNIEIVKI